MKNTQMLGHDISRRGVLFGCAGTFATVFLTGCQPSTVVSALENVVGLAELAIGVLGSAAGLSPQTQAAIIAYLQVVNTAAAQATLILAGPGSSAQKAAQILAAFASIAQGCNCIPTGTPANVVNAINAVAQAVARFLANFGGGVQAQAEKPAPPIKIKAQDVSALANIRNRAEQNLAKLKGLQK